MHSSRMRTVRSSGRILGGVCSQGVSAVGGCLLPGGCLLQGGLLPGGVCSGVSAPRGGCLLLGGVVSQHALRQTPPPRTDRRL